MSQCLSEVHHYLNIVIHLTFDPDYTCQCAMFFVEEPLANYYRKRFSFYVSQACLLHIKCLSLFINMVFLFTEISTHFKIIYQLNDSLKTCYRHFLIKYAIMEVK